MSSVNALTTNGDVLTWVKDIQDLCQPDQVNWCDGSLAEKEAFEEEAVERGILKRLDPKKLPGCFYARSDKQDVARTEKLTFICSTEESNSGPLNNWMRPETAYKRCREILRDSMKGRTLYVVPFIMGPAGSPGSKIGIQLTDSLYVVLNMRIMTRMGQVALDQLGDSKDYTKCMHGMVDLSIDRRLICHFPDDNAIWSVGSNYGGNALLGKKCMALRIASALAKKENWLAEHMLIIGIQPPAGKVRYFCAAFPSQCGKTNMAMLVPPLEMKGYKVTTVGDDIAWLRVGPDGRLWAINPENGFFGVAPGTSHKTNPVALKTIASNTIYTNVALKPDNTVWWEGLSESPELLEDWKGEKWTRTSATAAAHPNSRFTAPTVQCPQVSAHWDYPPGVPIDGIIFGGRRNRVAPLVYEAMNWNHGTYLGATMASETTAAATGEVGIVRRDPMAMKPFIGYHAGDYFQHWLDMGKMIPRPPRIFHVNWFKKDTKNEYLWPGFGENLRVVEWMLRRVSDKVQANVTPIGYMPKAEDLNLEGLNISEENLKELLAIHGDEWEKELEDQEVFFDSIGPKLPQELREEHQRLRDRLHAAHSSL